jgi:hypothetical protein
LGPTTGVRLHNKDALPAAIGARARRRRYRDRGLTLQAGEAGTARHSELTICREFLDTGLSPDPGEPMTSRMLDLETLERCRADIEGLGRELLSKARPRVARELKDLCRLLRARVIASHKFGDVVEPLDRIAEAAALLERQRKSNHDVASYELRHALLWLATILVHYREPGRSR